MTHDLTTDIYESAKSVAASAPAQRERGMGGMEVKELSKILEDVPQNAKVLILNHHLEKKACGEIKIYWGISEDGKEAPEFILTEVY